MISFGQSWTWHTLDPRNREGNVAALGGPFKMLREGHQVNQSQGTVVNLSQTRILNKDEMSVLQRGLSFIPRGTGMDGSHCNRLDAEAGLTA